MELDKLNIFIGYDSSEIVAFHTCCQSILENSSIPVSFTPIGIKNCPSDFKRPRGKKDSTEFAITRFLTPYMSSFKGYSLFMDSDTIVLGDVKKLIDEIDQNKVVSLVKHNYAPKSQKKFLNHEQLAYKRKNWSSVIVFNNEKCKNLSLDYVENCNGLDLHQFKWCNDKDIGEISINWNFLVGEYKNNNSQKLLHYTIGTPCFEDYKNTEFSDEWYKYYGKVISPLKQVF